MAKFALLTHAELGPDRKIIEDSIRKTGHDLQSPHNVLLHVAKIQTFSGGRPQTNATGFFYQQDGYLYLVTARHVVDNPSVGHRPDSLQVSLHVDIADLKRRRELSIPLHVDGVSQWYQHPTCRDADIVAVAINDPTVIRNHVIAPLTPDDLLHQTETLPLGQDVLIVGFPLGFHDKLHNLPIVRSAIVASSFSHPFNGNPYFLTDARLHRGMSGSPVFTRLQRRREGANQPEDQWKLLGIHTSALDVSDRDPGQDERLALNTTWYSSLIPPMLPASPIAGRTFSVKS